LSVTDLGAPANTVLQKSTRVVTKAWTIVFMDSSPKDRHTRRSWRRWIELLQMLKACTTAM